MCSTVGVHMLCWSVHMLNWGVHMLCCSSVHMFNWGVHMLYCSCAHALLKSANVLLKYAQALLELCTYTTCIKIFFSFLQSSWILYFYTCILLLTYLNFYLYHTGWRLVSSMTHCIVAAIIWIALFFTYFFKKNLCTHSFVSRFEWNHKDPFRDVWGPSKCKIYPSPKFISFIKFHPTSNWLQNCCLIVIIQSLIIRSTKRTLLKYCHWYYSWKSVTRNTTES